MLMIKPLLIGLIVLVIAGAGYAFMHHYTTLKSERDMYFMRTEISEQSHSVTRATFEVYRTRTLQDIIDLQTNLDALGEEYEEARQDAQALEKLLSRHNFGELSKRKPGLIQSRVNRAVDKLFDDIEKATAKPGSHNATGDPGDSAEAEPTVPAISQVHGSEREGQFSLRRLYSGERRWFVLNAG